IGIIGLWKSDTESDISVISEWEETIVLAHNAQNNRLLIITESFHSENLSSSSALLFICEQKMPCFYCNVTMELATDDLNIDSMVSIRSKFSLNLEMESSGNEKIELALKKLESRFDVSSSEENDKSTRILSNVYKHGNFLIADDASSSYAFPENLNYDTATLLDLLKLQNIEGEKKSRRKSFSFVKDHLDFSLLQNITPKHDPESVKYIPIIHHEIAEFTKTTLPVTFLPLSICSVYTPLCELPILLNEAVLRQIKCARLSLFASFNETSDLVILRPYTFCLSNFGHFLTIYYPSNSTDESLESCRQQIIREWNLPSDRPTVRKNNTFCFPDETGNCLRNVHLEVGTSGSSRRIQATVYGNYQYHHYMQDNFDDKGWGCAYRSFQTIWSWFLLQGYTAKPVPSHGQIQQALIDIGDRPQNFFGTKQWIGSLELSYCLSHLLQVESKILNVSSGSELTQKVRELIAHFEIEGTPIMIGGGVLAHTILGVHFCEETGDVKYLVLDPHYVGEENAKTIVDKGWCGWKPSSFWTSDTFYNLLLPQRPKNMF
uniref:Ufm1-specific protease n=1 Tax=Romanomermis culicivorax TaxID=13658 RepID=A0A915KRG4_ROMCU